MSAAAIPQTGGSLDFNGEGIAGCVRCGWRGVPTLLRGRRTGRLRVFDIGGLVQEVAGSTVSTFCPACEADLDEPQPAAKVGRNDPCTCGSGRKFKKCHGR